MQRRQLGCQVVRELITTDHSAAELTIGQISRKQCHVLPKVSPAKRIDRLLMTEIQFIRYSLCGFIHLLALDRLSVTQFPNAGALELDAVGVSKLFMRSVQILLLGGLRGNKIASA